MKTEFEKTIRPAGNAIPLFGFDHDGHVWHVEVYAMPDGHDDCIGLRRQGDPFCLRIDFRSFVQMWKEGKAEHIEGHG